MYSRVIDSSLDEVEDRSRDTALIQSYRGCRPIPQKLMSASRLFARPRRY
jgi:hypothetical protein